MERGDDKMERGDDKMECGDDKMDRGDDKGMALFPRHSRESGNPD